MVQIRRQRALTSLRSKTIIHFGKPIREFSTKKTLRLSGLFRRFLGKTCKTVALTFTVNLEIVPARTFRSGHPGPTVTL